MRSKPTIAFVTIGSGSYLGATVHHLTLANSLHKRGYKVFVYWMMDQNPDLVADGVGQRILCHGTRYQFLRPSELMDRLLGPLLFLLPRPWRVRLAQNIPGYVEMLMRNLLRSLYALPSADPSLAERLHEYAKLDGVTHLMVSLGTLAPLAVEAQRLGDRSFDYLATFQGDEEFAHHAAQMGMYPEYLRRMHEAIQSSRWPAIAISEDYLHRLASEFDLRPEQMRVVYPGIDLPGEDRAPPFSLLEAAFPGLTRDAPIVAFLGRQESEKGVDLLLYATKILRRRGVRMQLVICGPTAKGRRYQAVISELTGHLRLKVHHHGVVSREVRDALYAHSHCIVYPSVNREPFGLVVAEAMSWGTPVVVPDHGGVGEIVRRGGVAGGLMFRTWNSGDLARQLERLLVDQDLHQELAANTRVLAARFSADRMTDRLLAHMGMIPAEAEELLCTPSDQLSGTSRWPEQPLVG